MELKGAGVAPNITTPFSDRIDRNFSIGLASTCALINSLTLDVKADSEMEYFAETSSDKTLTLKSKVEGI